MLSDTICVEHGLSIVENPKPHGKSYGDWLGDEKIPSHREHLRLILDAILEKNPADFQAMLTMLKDSGVEIKRRGNTISLKCKGRAKYVRFSSLGDGYTESDLTAFLSGEKKARPAEKAENQRNTQNRPNQPN